MTITDLSKFSKCLVRNRLVVQTPEEVVRQWLLDKMIHELGYPKGLISVEKKIGSRRFDIVVFTQEMNPILLIECKANGLKEAENQAIGYNQTVKAPFICLASSTEIKTFWSEQGQLKSVPFLPMYKQLFNVS